MTRGSFVARGRSLILIMMLLSIPARTSARDDCAQKVMEGYLSELPGWTIEALESGEDGVKVVSTQNGDPRFLMLGLALEGDRLYTFVSTRGLSQESTVPPEVTEKLESIWDRFWKDPAVKDCPAFTVTAAPLGDNVYKRMETMVRDLETGIYAKADEISLAALLIPIVCVLIVLSVLIWFVVRRRRQKKSTVSRTAVPEVPGDDEINPAP